MNVIPPGLLWFFKLFVWLSDFVRRIEREPALGLARAGGWPALKRVHLANHPACEVCGSEEDCTAHHVRPVHVSSELELDPANLWTMCGRCHLLIGHLGDWRSWNIGVRFDSEILRKKIRERPYYRRAA
jgi:hypothetical protein